MLHEGWNGVDGVDLLVVEVLVEAGEGGEVAILGFVYHFSHVFQIDEQLPEDILVNVKERAIYVVEKPGYGSEIGPVAPYGLGAVAPQPTVLYEPLYELKVSAERAQPLSSSHIHPLGVDLTSPYD